VGDRRHASRRRRLGGGSRKWLALAALAGAAFAVLATGRIAIAAPEHATTGALSADARPFASHSVSLRGGWERYLAPERTCPGGESTTAPLAAQTKTMACLVNYARAMKGLRKLRVSPLLSLAARRKGEEIQRCRVFDHAPCGGRFDEVAVEAGYSGSFGENLLLGEGSYGAPRWALAEWLASAGHRAILLSARWKVQSAYVAHVSELDGMHDATLWVAQFGDR
jgi:uncharacterized protein YkwD